MMYKVGELFDKGLGDKLVQTLKGKGLSVFLKENIENKSFELWAYDESALEEAFEHYRMAVGIPRPIEIDEEWQQIQKIPLGRITKTIIGICLFIFFFELLVDGENLKRLLSFSNYRNILFVEIKNGEIWRLITPAFLHFGFMHIIFNMLWMKDLGSLIEDQYGVSFFLTFISLTAIISNLSQYFVSGGHFGGMSGVIYGLLGFIWVYKKLNPEVKYSLPARDINLMIFWFILCLTGLIGSIANAAHGVGLFCGVVFAVGRSFLNDRGSFNIKMVYFFFLSAFLAGLGIYTDFYRSL